MKKISKRILSLTMALLIILSATPLMGFTVHGADSHDDNYGIEATNSFGNILTNSLNEAQVSDRTEDYSLYGIEFNGKTATVSYSSLTEGKIIVAVYSEKGQMLGYGMSNAVDTWAHTVKVTVDITSMPDYFVAKSFLVNDNMAPLCAEYTCNTYTKEYQEFLKKDINDFDRERVINLDESENNNFAVVSSEAKIIEDDTNKNTLISADEENGIYKFNNPDTSLKDVSEGDIFFYSYGDNDENSIVVKVKSVIIDGNNVTVYAEDAEIEDIFEFVKIDTHGNPETSYVAEASLGNGVARTNAVSRKKDSINESGSFSDHFDLEKSWKNDSGVTEKISGSVDITVAAKLKCYYGSKKYFDFLLELTADYTVTVTLSVSASAKKSFDIAEFTIPLCMGINAKVDCNFTLNGYADIVLTQTKHTVFGIKYNKSKGLTDFDENTQTLDSNAESNLKIKIGIEFKIGLEALDIITATVSLEPGLDITCTVTSPQFTYGDNVLHECTLCGDGNAKTYLKISANVDVGFELLWMDVNKSLFDKSYTTTIKDKNGKYVPGAFYISLGSGGLGFGMGSCPNKSYKVTVIVTDTNGTPLSGVSVMTQTTDSTGKAILYLKNGTHTITASSDNYGANDAEIKINNKQNSLTIKLSGTSYTPSECFEYTVNSNGKVSITGLKDKSLDVISIPPTINGKSVVDIRYYAFSNCTNLSSVTLPDSLETMMYGAFSGCSGLKKINIPKNVRSLGYSDGGESGVFWNCKNLEEITVDKNNQYFSSENGVVFNKNKTRLVVYPQGKKDSCYTIPNTVAEIEYWGEQGFDGNKHLKSINTNASNPNLTSVNGVLFNKDKTILIRYPEGKDGTSYTIPSTVKTIYYDAFENCGFTSISIPGNVKNICEGAFSNCTQLKTVVIKDGVKNIDEYAFADCDNLTSIAIPQSITSMTDALYGCDNLTDIYYGGTESEWRDWWVEDLDNVTIHYNSSGGKTSTNAVASSSGTQALGKTQMQTVYTDPIKADSLVPGNQYIVCVYIGDMDIQYINQAVADSNGNLQIDCYTKDFSGEAKLLIAGDFGGGSEQRIEDFPIRELSFFEKIINAIVAFFKNIADFFRGLFN